MAINIWQNLLFRSNIARATILILATVKFSDLIWYACVYSYFSIGPHAEHHTHQSWSHGDIQLYC